MTDRYGVIGNPVEHSLSPLIHGEFARQTGQDIEYVRVLAPRQRFADEVRRFRESGGRGLNVTLPFKEEAFRIASRLSPRARAAQAVNTLRFEAQLISGDNTDGAGLVRDLVGRLGIESGTGRILLLGAGGAARGVIGPLLELRPSSLVIANRTAAKALRLAGEFGAPVEGGGYEGLAGRAFDLVVNATSASLAGEAPTLPAGCFAPGALVYDMMYAARNTVFLDQALAAGAARVSDGLGMLVEQAAESFLFWRGVRPLTAPAFALARRSLAR